MTDTERLGKLLAAQEKEIARLRKLLSVVRVASVDYSADGKVLNVLVTCIGVDEFHFIEQLRPELGKIADVIAGQRMELQGAKNMVTGEPLIGGVSPQPGDGE